MEKDSPEKNTKQKIVFPQKLKRYELVILFICYFGLFLILIYISALSPCLWGTYLAFGLLITFLLVDRIIRHKFRVHKARLVDPSSVDSRFVDVQTIEPRLSEPQKPDDYSTKKQQVIEEKERLEKFGYYGCTEHQVLSLDQLLIDFLQIDELKARALSNLSKLQEYAEASNDINVLENYKKLEDQINDSIEEIDESSDDPKRQDEISEKLRGQLSGILEEIAEYDYLWTEGSEIINSIRMCGIITIFPLIVMGLLPILHPLGDKVIGILNWGLLGISGAITSVLWSFRKSNLLEVGDTEGKKELWRAVLGAGLGFVAGILLYSMILGKILAGELFPNLSNINKPNGLDMGRSIFWGIASGFSLEFVFDRLRSATDISN